MGSATRPSHSSRLKAKNSRPGACRSRLKFIVLLWATFISVGAFLSTAVTPVSPENLWALVIGVSNYTHAEPLRYAASDAGSFSRFLESPRGGEVPPDHIFTLLEDQATRRAIEVELELMQDRVEQGDTVYIYFAGHGFINRRGLGYFIPSDGNLRVPASTSVSFSVLKELVDLGLAHAERRIMITDLCNAGRIGPHRSELTQKIQNLINAELLKLGAGRPGSFLNLLASRPTEASWESDDLGRGVFTHTLLEALNGGAVAPGDLIVEAREMVDYVSREVPKYTRNQQHPMANENFDPSLPLSFLDRPGPTEKVTTDETYLIIMNINSGSFRRVQWSDPGTQALAVHPLPADGAQTQIEALVPGKLDLQFFDAENQSHSITVTLQPGENLLDLATADLGVFQAVPFSQVAALRPEPVIMTPVPLVPALQASAQPADAILVVRLQQGTDIYIDDGYLGTSEEEDRPLQLRGLTRGSHQLRLVPSPDREHRFRVNLFRGPQVFDLESGEIRSVARVQPTPAQLAVPPAVPPQAEQVYRQFLQALWEDRLVRPEGDSAWDYYSQLEDLLQADFLDTLKYRLVVAMGNRAQRIILKYLRGGDIRWSAEIFEEGEVLLERSQALFKETATFESQERFFAGRALIESGDYSGALQELRQSIDLDAEASHAYNALGLVLWKQNLLLEAITPLEQAIELSPRWTYPRITLALIYVELRRYQEAEQDLQTAIQVDSEDSTAYHGLGQLYSLLGRFQEAEGQLLQALEMNPGNAYALETLGKLYQRLQRRDEAEQMFRLAIRLEPEEPSFRLSLGELLRQIGQIQEAQSVFQQVASQNPNDAQVLTGYANFLAAAGQPQQADRLFQQALRVAPDDANLHVRYGMLLQSQDRQGDAENEFRRAIRISPANAFAHYNLASLYLSQQKLSQAETELRRAMRADQRLAAPPMLLGQIRFAQRRYREALEHYRNALGLSIEAHQRQQLTEFIAETEAAIVSERLSEAQQRAERRRYSDAWSIYADVLKDTPDNQELRNALLRFQSEQPEAADVAALPASRLTSTLQTSFWRSQLRAERLWRVDEKQEAAKVFVDTLESLDAEERRLVTATYFNLRNEEHGIHQLIYRWGLRLIEQGNYDGALSLLDTAVQKNIFGQVPGVQLMTIDSLMSPADEAEPQAFADFEIAHHPDRRAHEIYAAAYAGAGDLERAGGYLPAIEGVRPDLSTRLLMSRTLQREQNWTGALSVFNEIVSNPLPDSDAALLAEIFIVAAEIRCQAGDCEAGRAILERGRELWPDDRRIEQALRRLGF